MTEVLDETTWRERATAHAARVDAFIEPHLARRGSSVKHPVHDFLFTYYSQRPAQLRRWHPGYGVALAGDASAYAGLKGYVRAATPLVDEGAATPLVDEGAATPLVEEGAATPLVEEGAATPLVEEVALQPSRNQHGEDADGNGFERRASARSSTNGRAGGNGFETRASARSSTNGRAGGNGFETRASARSSTNGRAGGNGFETRASARSSTNGDVTVSAEYVASQRPLIESLHRLLTATAGRAPTFGCFGLHEWAMVYRLSEDETRHADWPLRLGASGTDEVVESHKITCSHFDAFRFFTPPARPLNQLQPGRDDRPAYEQPGCLHGGMDLYKHAFRLTPMICSDLVADCFELARDIRVLDMQAAPYDLVDLGFEPVRIETFEGKQEYAARQRGFAERGAPLRQGLIDECARLLAVTARSA